MINLKSVNNTLAMLKLIKEALISFLNLKTSDKKEIMQSNLQREDMIEFIVKFIKNDHKLEFKKMKYQRLK